ncbi:MAG: hypothetical protein KAU47_00335 [Candidatus Aminicenantes bacterium]|nr:hypothetical protein [Candidatus Aminicenantes bacterium]
MEYTAQRIKIYRIPEDERWLLSIRQGAAIYVTMWAMEAAVVAFHEVSPE